jgi:hypothetical protein
LEKWFTIQPRRILGCKADLVLEVELKLTRHVAPYWIFIMVIFSWICGEVFAGNLAFTPSELSRIKALCPDCNGRHVMVCGKPEIGPGKRFRPNFFQGNPSRGFLITPPILVGEFRDLLRNEPDYERLVRTVKERFSKMEIIAIDRSFGAVGVIRSPDVSVAIPKKLHDCLSTKGNKWGCGVAPPGETECCEKSLGSPVVRVRWTDHKQNEIIELTYASDIGSVKLIRITQTGSKILYYCLNTEGSVI